MKLLIASDIHGSSYYTELLLNCFVNENADKLVLLGDFLYHGPRNPLPQGYNPLRVCELLNNYKDKIIALKGNCDAQIDLDLLDFPISEKYAVIPFRDRIIFLTHGDLYNLDNPPLLNKRDILVNGHFHKQTYLADKNFIYINPGSISLPKDNINGYIILTDTSIIFKNLKGEVLNIYNI